MEIPSPSTAPVVPHGDINEQSDLEESIEGSIAKEDCTEPPGERAPNDVEDKPPNLCSIEFKQSGSGDCTDFAASVLVDDNQSLAESHVDEAVLSDEKEGLDNSVDRDRISTLPSDTNSEETLMVPNPEQESACTENLIIAEDLAEAKVTEESNKEKLGNVSEPCATPQYDMGGACAAPPRTRTSTKDDARTVVDFEDEMELWLWINDIIDECEEDVSEEQDYTQQMTELFCDMYAAAEQDGDQHEDGAPLGTLETGKKRSVDGILHEKLKINRQEFNREWLRRVTIRAYGKHLPRGVDPSKLGHYFFEVLPELFSRIAWFDASYTQIEMNNPGDFNTISLFIVPGVEFWGHIPLPYPLETRLSLGQQKCRLEELALWTEYNRKGFAKTFFSVADKYKLPKFWKAQVSNFDKVVLVVRERIAEMKKVKKKDLKKLAPQKTFQQVFEAAYESLSKAYEKLLCPKCNRQFREAVAFEACAHELCTGCVADCLRSQAPCPVCHTTLKGTRFLPVWRFQWYDEGIKLGEGQNQETPGGYPESDCPTRTMGLVKTGGPKVVDGSQNDAEGRHKKDTEVGDDTWEDAEGQQEVGTEIHKGSQKDSDGGHEAEAKVVDDSPKDSENQHSMKYSENQHDEGAEIVDDSLEVPEGQLEDDRTEIPEQDIGDGFQSLSVDDDGIEALPTAKCG
ncbi:uncharacterized protein LOC144864022 [Branchiostoma floridae x Branchiostoma japonicum]